jgi:hypothetical protein
MNLRAYASCTSSYLEVRTLAAMIYPIESKIAKGMLHPPIPLYDLLRIVLLGMQHSITHQHRPEDTRGYR